MLFSISLFCLFLRGWTIVILSVTTLLTNFEFKFPLSQFNFCPVLFFGQYFSKISCPLLAICSVPLFKVSCEGIMYWYVNCICPSLQRGWHMGNAFELYSRGVGFQSLPGCQPSQQGFHGFPHSLKKKYQVCTLIISLLIPSTCFLSHILSCRLMLVSDSVIK